jgi:integrase
METAITITSDLNAIGLAFNQAAAASEFRNYLERKAVNTLRRQHADLALFARYLKEVRTGIDTTADDLQSSAESWRGITWGMVQGFRQWQLNQGYAVNSVNVRLSTVKVYVKLAFKSGVISTDDYALIKAVEGYRLKEGKRVDEKRSEAGLKTRQGAKKANAVHIDHEHAKALKTAPDTPQGRRDAVLMCLLLDHGLRCGEVAILKVGHVDLKAGQLKFFRPKVEKEQTHNLSRDTIKALKAWFDSGDAPLAVDAPLLRGSRKGGALLNGGMSDRAITARVEMLGSLVGLDGLSAHDCRHYWATKHAERGVDPFRLQEAGGWNSLAMPRRYVEAAKIANEGMGD